MMGSFISDFVARIAHTSSVMVWIEKPERRKVYESKT